MSLRRDFSYSRKGRYYLSHAPTGHEQYLCFVLHGYGQLPQHFIKKFSTLQRPDVLFVAPEGLHRFYLSGSAGRVGSSWMTKEERLSDIADYVQMLDAVAAPLWAQARFRKKAILGFSQGVATACRWLTHSQFRFDELINWAGAFPPDLDFVKALDKMPRQPLRILVGDEDEYATPAQRQEQARVLEEKGIPYTVQVYRGVHRIVAEVLAPLMDEVFPRL